jgi:hypothetical protein
MRVRTACGGTAEIKKVDIFEAGGFKFAVHKPLHGQGWAVSEYTTGGLVLAPRPRHTKIETVEVFRALFLSPGMGMPEKLAARIELLEKINGGTADKITPVTCMWDRCIKRSIGGCLKPGNRPDCANGCDYYDSFSVPTEKARQINAKSVSLCDRSVGIINTEE